MCRCAAALARAVVDFLDAVLFGFFLSFFRPRPRDDSPPVPSARRRDPLEHEDRLRELLSDDERGFGGRGGSHEDLADDCGDDEELQSEANYLKLIGTIPEIPAELQNVSYQINLEHYIEHDDFHTNALAVEATPAFDAKSPEGFLSAIGDKSPYQNIKSTTLGSNDSPFPTPVVLREDMQTPGTVYTSHRSSGKRVRTRKQFVYPILRSIENKLQQMEVMELTEDSCKPPERRSLGTDSIKKPHLTSSDLGAKGESPDSLPLLEESMCQLGTQRQLDDEAPKYNSDENLEVCSLSRWLKSSPAGIENQSHVECSVGGRLYDGNNLIEEGHAFMASEANWDVENPTPRLSKAWDRHGIPNTTRKFREILSFTRPDQKVSWHSTPFEKRLLKVLSEEEVPPTRNLSVEGCSITSNEFEPEERVML